MSSRVIAERYARALFAAAREQGIIDAVAADLTALLQALAQSTELEHFFYHRQLSPARKQTMLMPVLQEILKEKITRNFIQLLWQKKRETELTGIVAAYQAALRESKGQLVVEITATRQLSVGELEQLRRQVKALTNCEMVELKTQVDKSLLGGVVLRIGDKVYDGSLARRLQQLRQKILQAQVHQSGVS